MHLSLFIRILSALLLCSFDGRGQSYWENYEVISTRQGLPHNTIQTLLQDKEGYLWIGTYNGLSLYDGNKLTTFKNVFGDEVDNWSHAIDALFEDKDGNVWIGSKGGLVSCFIRNTRKFNVYERDTLAEPVQVNCFYQDKKGTIWLGNYNGKLGYISGNTIRYVYPFPYGIISILSTGSLITVLTKKGLYTYDPEYKNAKPLFIDGMPDIGFVKASVCKDNLAILHWYGCIVVNLTSKKISANSKPASVNLSLGHITFKTEGGYYYVNASTLYEYSSYGILENSFSIGDNAWHDKNEIINCVIEDRSGILWLGTNSGLYKINKRKYLFKKYSRYNVSGKLADNYIRTIYADTTENLLWVGTRTGRINILKRDQKAKEYQLEATYPILTEDGRLLENYTTNVFLRLKDGRILAGGEGGIYVFNKNAGLFRPFMAKHILDSLYLVWALYQDDNNNIWIGTSDAGLYIVELKSGKTYHYTNKVDEQNTLINNSVWSIYEDTKGSIWIGTNDGLCEVRKKEDVSKLKFDRRVFNKNERVHVWDIKEDKEGNLWIGTTGHGLFEITADRSGIITHNRFPAKVIACIVPLTPYELWISTVKGMYKYNAQKGTYSLFDEDDGLISDDYNFKAAAITNTGEIFFGGKMGMVGFYPARIPEEKVEHFPVRITSLQVEGKDRMPDMYAQKKLHLSYADNSFILSFSILEFSNPKKHKYRYILDGFDKKWNYSDASQPTAGYTNIPPGNYRFVVEGSSDGLRWSKNSAVLPVYIRPALWQRPIFWIICFVTVLAGAVALLYYRVRVVVTREREKNRLEKQMAALELKALQAQMNPHFIFNTINAIQHFIIHKDEVAANDYLSRFAKLMRLFLESSKNKYISLETEVELLRLYLSLEKLRFDDKFDYEIIVENNAEINTVLIPSMLIQPFAENAIKHGLVHKRDKGWLKIIFSLNNQTLVLRCTIEDNGVGRKRSEEINAQKNSGHISRGMELIEERIKTYNFIDDQNIEILITDKEPPLEGTKIEILIPTSPGNL